MLADGRTVTLRPIRPEDGAELRRAWERLSPTSRYRRFLGSSPTLSDEVLRYLTDVDGVDHVAIVAVMETPDLKSERGIGVARFVRSKEKEHADRAEAAVTVVDDEQGKGVGKLLLASLVEEARARDVRWFTAEVLASNAPMRALLDRSGAILREDAGETLVYDIPVEHDPHPDSLLRRLLRSAAATMVFLLRRLEPPALPAQDKPQ